MADELEHKIDEFTIYLTQKKYVSMSIKLDNFFRIYMISCIIGLSHV